jgi:nucleoside-diphosphate-sugar epimerase
MTRVLVTGARGFVGRHAIAHLQARGFEVHGVTASAVAPEDGSIRWHRADLLDANDRRQLVGAAAADVLLHLAWYAKPPGYWHDPVNMRWLSATLDLVQLFAERGGRRVVGTGTCAEYDWSHGLCTERVTPLSAASLYASTKAACGEVLQAYGARAGVGVAWARLFFLFGPHDDPSRFVPSMVTALEANQPWRCHSGNHVRDFLYVEDAAAALAALAASPVEGPVNVASGRPIRLGDLAADIAGRMGRAHLVTIEPGGPQHASVTADVRRLHHEVGWRPACDPGEALARTIRWWSATGRRQVPA